MRGLLLALLISFTVLSASADRRIVQGNKLYIVQESYLSSTDDQILKLYSFPQLVLQKELNITDLLENGYLTDLQVSDAGVLIGTLRYNDSYVDHPDEGYTTVTYIDVKTVLSFDSNLAAIAEEVTEDTYSYDYYWIPITGATDCPDKVKNTIKTLSKKKGGGKKGGSSANCSVVKHINHKSFTKSN